MTAITHAIRLQNVDGSARRSYEGEYICSPMIEVKMSLRNIVCGYTKDEAERRAEQLNTGTFAGKILYVATPLWSRPVVTETNDEPEPADLDFEIHGTAALMVEWTVFDTESGRDVRRGVAFDRNDAMQCAVAFIAKATPHRLFILRTRAGFSLWHRNIANWMPLAFTPNADAEDVRDHVASMQIAAGRSVHVVSHA